MPGEPSGVPWTLIVVVAALGLTGLAAWEPGLRRPILGLVIAVIALYASFLAVVVAALAAMDTGGVSPLVYVVAIAMALGGLAIAYRVAFGGRRRGTGD